MNRIDGIFQLKDKCTGCMACVDACPVGIIKPITDPDGFRYSLIDESGCVGCEKCYNVCPIENKEKHNEDQHLYAAYAKQTDVRNNGSSGGIFELLAKTFANNGYYVCGAAFDKTTLKHCLVSPGNDIKPLLKSKYVQSDTVGIYNKILKLLRSGEKVFFCGTPCQVSALMNFIPCTEQEGLFTADIICHGVPSQKLFDSYIETLEKKHKGEIVDFSFRVKDNRYKHAHGYSYKVLKGNKTKVVNGIYTNSSYYNAFKNYLTFRNSCYDCQYATLQRTSDITLADFWGIERYDFEGNVDKGVSMILTNTEKGRRAFSSLCESVDSKEFPVEYGVESNFCLTHTTRKPKNRDNIIREFATDGYEQVSKKYFASSIVYKLYWLIISPKIRNFLRKWRGN